MSITSANEPCRTPCGGGIPTREAAPLRRITDRLRRLGTRLREIHAEQMEAQERLLLLNMPWKEDYLHWAGDGSEHLHGHVAPPDDRRRHSVTRSGWCPGSRTP